MGRFFKRLFRISIILLDVIELFEHYMKFVETSKKELEKVGLDAKADKLVRRTQSVVSNLKNILPKRYLK